MLKPWRERVGHYGHDVVRPSVRGKPMQASALLQRGLHPALQHAGLRRVRFHDLRYSFASNLFEAGIDIVTVSKALGRANVHITLTIDAHAVPKARQGASDRMAALLGGEPSCDERMKVETKWKQGRGRALTRSFNRQRNSLKWRRDRDCA
jgi:integrase